MNPLALLTVLALPFVVMGIVVAYLTISIGRETRS